MGRNPIRRNRRRAVWMGCAAIGLAVAATASLSANDDCPQGTFPVSTQADFWGRAVAMDAGGTHALVGGPAAAGGNGRVRTFVESGGSWTETAILLPDAAFQAGAEFGAAIAMSADGLTAVIGAPGDRHGGALPFGGSVYVVVRAAGSDVWAQQARLLQPSPGTRYRFGTSVAISDDGNTIVVGQVGDTFFGVPNDSAWSFHRTGTTWSAASELAPIVNDESEDFGIAVAISADGAVAAVGAPGQLAVGAGAAYVFNAAGSTWAQEAKLVSAVPVSGSGLGRAVAVAGGQILVGSPFDNGGALHVHEKQGGAWVRRQTIRLPGHPLFDSFGGAIAVRGERSLVGSPTTEFNMGKAFLMERTNGDWAFAGQMAPPTTDAVPGTTAGYGSSVAFSADATEFVIGAPNLGNGGTFNVGKAYFPDFVVEPVVLDLQKGACTIGFGFTLPNGNYIDLSFDVIGQIWAFLTKGCEQSDEVGSYEISAVDLWTVQNEAVIEWSPRATLVFTDLHVTLDHVGDPIVPDAQGQGTLNHYGIVFSANLQLGRGRSIPMSWTAEFTANITIGSVDGVVTLAIPPTYGQLVLDLGLGPNNPVADYAGTMLASEPTPPPCPADLDLDGSVGAPDLAILLGDWDARASAADLDADGIVGAPDLAILLGAWGPCPQ